MFLATKKPYAAGISPAGLFATTSAESKCRSSKLILPRADASLQAFRVAELLQSAAPVSGSFERNQRLSISSRTQRWMLPPP